MTMTGTEHTSSVLTWWRRFRIIAAAALIWAGLHFVAGGLVLPRGLDRPPVLIGAQHGLMAGFLVIGVVWLGTALGTVIIRPKGVRTPLMIVGLALALWGAEGGRAGGTMDEWLVLRNETPGAPTSGPYWLLLVDYACLLIAVAGAYAIAVLRSRGGEGIAAGDALRRAFGQGMDARKGVAALVVTTVVAGVVVFILTGPTAAATLRGQVYFAVLVGFFAGSFAAGRLVGASGALWYWPAPFLLGIIGLIVAGIDPALLLSDAYTRDTIPAWGLTRALPIEMIGVGLVGALWLLRATPARPEQAAAP